MKNNTITVFCPSGMDSFIIPLVGELRQYYNMYVFNQGNKYEFDEAIKSSNVSWFEWCIDHIVEATHTARSSKLVCRMHSFEAFTDKPAHVNWNMVERLIVPNISVIEVNQFYKGFVAEQLGRSGQHVDVQLMQPIIPDHKICVVPNYVDTDKMSFVKNRNFKKKICFVGHINFKKNFEHALNLFHAIKKIDPQYTLHIAGDFQEPRHALYFDLFLRNHGYELNKDIFYYGWVNNVREFFADMDFILSTSLYESFHLSIAEAMSTGVIPLVYKWFGSNYIYPEDFLFLDNAGCYNIMKSAEESKDIEKIRKNVSKFIETNFSKKIIIPQYVTILDYMCYGDKVKQYANENSINDVSSIENLEKIASGTKLSKSQVHNVFRGMLQDGLYIGEICDF